MGTDWNSGQGVIGAISEIKKVAGPLDYELFVSLKYVLHLRLPLDECYGSI
jgi:hypothetical protein